MNARKTEQILCVIRHFVAFTKIVIAKQVSISYVPT